MSVYDKIFPPKLLTAPQRETGIQATLPGAPGGQSFWWP